MLYLFPKLSFPGHYWPGFFIFAENYFVMLELLYLHDPNLFKFVVIIICIFVVFVNLLWMWLLFALARYFMKKGDRLDYPGRE